MGYGKSPWVLLKDWIGVKGVFMKLHATSDGHVMEALTRAFEDETYVQLDYQASKLELSVTASRLPGTARFGPTIVELAKANA